ncbi:GntR family transcriptional regulator [Roseibium sp. FZY0029]|uniref:GntR family transcriptional regulator n=1 Tax=Roseibium sp. FZY0029 TaxID=3116647 RepID=UPI002EBF5C12|nr:GntR family transcriptional regulator [Roseibium sp. FZY0029]
MNRSTLKPVRSRRTVQDQIYVQMRESLVNGAFRAGEQFTIQSLAEKFMTSHMPVREALRRLAAENALRIASTGTAVVPALDLDELTQICQARLILEPATVEIAFDHITPEMVKELESILALHKQCGAAGDVMAMLAENRKFHFRIYRASGNEVLFSQIENLWLRSGPYVRYLSDRMCDLLRTSYKEGFARHHDDMLYAVKRGDKAVFRNAMYHDIKATHDLLFRFLSEEPE